MRWLCVTFCCCSLAHTWLSSDVIKKIFVYPVCLLLGREIGGTVGGKQLLLTRLSGELWTGSSCIDGHHLRRSRATVNLLAFTLHEVLPLKNEVLGDLVADGELLNAKVVDNLGAQFEEGGHAEEAHQHGQVDEEMVADEADRIHVTHDLCERRLLYFPWLLGNVWVEVNHAEKV